MDVLTFFTVRLCPRDMHLIGVPTAEDIDILQQDINNLARSADNRLSLDFLVW